MSISLSFTKLSKLFLELKNCSLYCLSQNCQNYFEIIKLSILLFHKTIKIIFGIIKLSISLSFTKLSKLFLKLKNCSLYCLSQNCQNYFEIIKLSILLFHKTIKIIFWNCKIVYFIVSYATIKIIFWDCKIVSHKTIKIIFGIIKLSFIKLSKLFLGL